MGDTVFPIIFQFGTGCIRVSQITLSNSSKLFITGEIKYPEFGWRCPGRFWEASFKQGSSENDWRSDLYDCLEFKIVSNCCYPNCCRTNCGNFVNFGNFPSIQTYRYIANDNSCVLAHLCTCVHKYLCTCVPVYLCIFVSVYLCTCVLVYLFNCVLV